MILADTSAWVEFDRASGSAVDLRMLELVRTPGSLAVTEPVVMEVTAGARTDARERQLRQLLAQFVLHPVEPAADFEAATRVYRRCRGVGVTPRGFLDCLIAAVAWRTGASLLHQDKDLARVAAVLGLSCDPASPAA